MQKITMQHSYRLVLTVIFFLLNRFAFSQVQQEKAASDLLPGNAQAYEHKKVQVTADSDLETIRKRFVTDLLDERVMLNRLDHW